ncbi:hypothetical protein MTO96_005063 [Rhipicephalus appendiculatus]
MKIDDNEDRVVKRMHPTAYLVQAKAKVGEGLLCSITQAMVSLVYRVSLKRRANSQLVAKTCHWLAPVRDRQVFGRRWEKKRARASRDHQAEAFLEGAMQSDRCLYNASVRKGPTGYVG